MLEKHWKRFIKNKEYFQFNWNLYRTKHKHFLELDKKQKKEYIQKGIHKGVDKNIIFLFKKLEHELEIERLWAKEIAQAQKEGIDVKIELTS